MKGKQLPNDTQLSGPCIHQLITVSSYQMNETVLMDDLRVEFEPGRQDHPQPLGVMNVDGVGLQGLGADHMKRRVDEADGKTTTSRH